MHKPLPPADKLPWTIAYVIRKRAQIDTFGELPKDKRPPDNIIWYGTSEEIDIWFDKVLKHKGEGSPDEFIIDIREEDIE